MTKNPTEETIRENFLALQRLLPKTAAEHLGIELVEVDAAHIVLTMPITDAARQPMGLLHGGINMVLAETAASMHACWGLDLTKTVPVGIEINGSHLRSAANGRVRAVGTVVSRGRALVVHEVRITHEETGRLLCIGRVTNFFKSVAAATAAKPSAPALTSEAGA